jgi:uncharacterized Tic20 family protein
VPRLLTFAASHRGIRGMSEQPESGTSIPPSQPPTLTTAGAIAADEKTMGMFAHLSALAGYIIPFGNIIGPLIVMLVKKDQSAFVVDQAREALNFQITIMLAVILSIALMFCVVGFFILPVLGIVNIVFIIIAAIKANGGEPYRYPMTLRLVK